MDKDGNWLWAEGIGSNKTDRANGIAIDVCDDIYITGEYRNPMVFPGANASNGSDTLSHKQRDVFVAKMNNQGQWKWAKEQEVLPLINHIKCRLMLINKYFYVVHQEIH